MKKVFALLALASLVASCSSTPKGTTVTNWLGKNVNLISALPDNGSATAERKPSTKISLQATSELYPITMFDENKTVVTFEYTRNSSNLPQADDFYREELLMEIPSSAFKKTYKNEALQDVKLIFGKHCYCKGEAGYYKISEGTLKVDHSEKNTHITLMFKTPVTSELQTVEFTVE